MYVLCRLYRSYEAHLPELQRRVSASTQTKADVVTQPASSVLPSEIRQYLFTHTIGQRIYYFPEVDSTNRVALDLAREGEPEGTLVVTDFQSAGKGRSDHTWHSPRGKDLLFSVILRPPGEPSEVLTASLAVALAVSVALTKNLDQDVGVKWPNDVMLGNRKLGGILAEGSVSHATSRFVVMGVGINVQSEREDFPAALRETAASCLTITEALFDRAGLLADVLGTIESYYDRYRREGFRPFVDNFNDRLVIAGKQVTVGVGGEAFTATVDSVQADGALRVTLESGEARLLRNETLTGTT